MKVLIIGGAGFLGSNLTRFCLRQPGVSVTVMDSLEPQLHATTAHLAPVWKQIRFVRGSLLDDAMLAEVVQDQDIIFNCAAQTSHPISIQNPLFDAEINCLGNLRLLENIRLLNGNAVVVYSSSSSVIGKAVTDVVDESHGEKPLEIYSANKGVAEKYYRIYHRVHDLKTVVLRFSNLFGPYGKGWAEFGFINYFIHLARNNEEIRVYGDGAQTRNVLYAEDAAEALWIAAQTPALFGETYFAAHEEHHTVADVAAGVVRVMGGGSVSHIPWPEDRKRIEIDRVLISGARLRSLTNWQPRHSLEEGLRKTRAILDGERSPPDHV